MNGTTILAINPHGSLTPAELERFAYIQGNGLLACYAGDADDLEGQVEGFDDLIDAAKTEAFEAGKREGIGLDTAEIIEDLERKVADLQASHQRCRNNLQAVYEWLRGEDSKTVKSRKAFEVRLLAALNVTPRY
jgi:hypothetical protein